MLEKFLLLVEYISQPISLIVFGFGATIGSFLNVCILRIPEKTFFKDQRSVCPSCSKRIPFWLNIPIISWCLLRGVSNCCQQKISKQYPIIEILTAVLTVFIYWQAPFIQWDSPSQLLEPFAFIRFCHMVLFTYLLLVCSVIDIHLQIIPDVISLPMVAISPLLALIHPELDLKSCLLGIFLGGGVLYGLAWLYFVIRKEAGMGMGDVKLLAAIGGWLGYQAILPTLFVASITGALIGVATIIVSRGSFRTAIPFGPFLSFGACVHLFLDGEISHLLWGISP